MHEDRTHYQKTVDQLISRWSTIDLGSEGVMVTQGMGSTLQYKAGGLFSSPQIRMADPFNKRSYTGGWGDFPDIETAHKAIDQIQSELDKNKNKDPFQSYTPQTQEKVNV